MGLDRCVAENGQLCIAEPRWAGVNKLGGGSIKRTLYKVILL